MKLQASQFAEVFNHLRDHAKPYTQQDAADLVKVRAPMKPDKQHLARLKRHSLGKVHVDGKPVLNVKTREICDAQHAFHKAMMAQLGGSRTIKPDAVGIERNVEREAGIRYINHPMASEAVPDKVVETDMEKLQREGERLKRTHHTAMLKCKRVPFDLVLSL